MIWLTTGGTLLAQAPLKVKESFAKKFPKAQNTNWEEDDDVYVAHFVNDTTKTEATFEKSGKWTESKAEVSLTKLPDVVKKVVLKKFEGSKLDEAVFIERPKSKHYEVSIITKDEKYLFVIVNEEGKILDFN